MSGGGSRVSIPNNVKKMIQNLKEMTGDHTEDEIYAMLRECNMDPNETAQKLLLQDPFHEVRRKHRKKDNMNRESGDSRWRSGMQGRGASRVGRVNPSSRHTLYDAGGGKNSGSGRDNEMQAVEKAAGSFLQASQEKTKEISASASVVIANGPSSIASGSIAVTSILPAESGINQHDRTSSPTIAIKPGTAVSPITESSSMACLSSSDCVLAPSSDSQLTSTAGAIKREVGSHCSINVSNADVCADKSASAIGALFLQGKTQNKSVGIKIHVNESSQPPSALIHSGSSGSRPPSSYSNRSQPTGGPQKGGTTKEWKPKPTNSNVPLRSVGSSDVSNIPVEANTRSVPESSVLDSEEATSKLQKKLEEMHLPPRQYVIIPNHIHVSESERTKLSFGSFDANFGINSSFISSPKSEKSSAPLSESSEAIEDAVEEHATSNQSTLVINGEGAYPDHPEKNLQVPVNLSVEGDVTANMVRDYNEAKQENTLLSGSHQLSSVHTSPTYSFGFVPSILGSQIAPFENSESQGRDMSRIPNFVVQQPFDPTSYYAQFYRSGADSDGRISPFLSPGVATKYNGNVASLPSHTSQSLQEVGNSLVLSTAGPTPLVTQAAGLMQSSIAVTQQPVPVFRSPAGLHIPHYPPNYIPYSHYFPQFYVPPPGIHQFLSNGAFPQQPQAGGVYPPPVAAGPAGVKYSLPPYKPGTNTGNSNHIGMPSGYGPYGSSPAGYNPSSTATGGNSTANEDLGTPQFKESNVYHSVQQTEGSTVWIAAPGRDISGLTASSFYNLPPQGQHVTFAPTQAGHGTFAGIYHPGQPVTAAAVHPLLQQSQGVAGAVDMVGPAANVYQQPQLQQINWPSNY